MTDCLVFDLGAGSGRAMIAHFDGRKITLSEIYRFTGIEARLPDGPHWDLDRLLSEIELGLEIASRHCGRITSIGIDSWGVDYALVDGSGQLEAMPYHYRNARSQRGYDAFPISASEVASKTGAQTLPVNTLYQLFSASRDTPDLLGKSRHALMIADAVNYHLTGVARSNVTLARTTGLLAASGTWHDDMLSAAGIGSSLFPSVIQPGTVVGALRTELMARIGQTHTIPIISVAAHDTASAVCGLPLLRDEAFLICGSWSIIGREIDRPIISDIAIGCGFGNEGGVEGRPIFLKSLNGLHLLQKLRLAWSEKIGEEVGFSDISDGARVAADNGRCERIDPSAPMFFDPPDLVEALRAACPEFQEIVENELGIFALAIYRGLVEDIAAALSALEKLTGGHVARLRICGGGGHDTLLCQMIANRTGREVAVGPIEASAWGNAILQLVGIGVVENLAEGRKLVEASTDISRYCPAGTMSGI